MNSLYFAETYNAIIAVGALAPNHITAVAFKEMLRIIKKGKLTQNHQNRKILRIKMKITKMGKNIFSKKLLIYL